VRLPYLTATKNVSIAAGLTPTGIQRSIRIPLPRKFTFYQILLHHVPCSLTKEPAYYDSQRDFRYIVMKRQTTVMQDVPAILHPQSLRVSASRIRDVLDPLVSREGPSILDPDDVLELHTIITTLQSYRIPLAAFRYSRIHFAIADICGKATRWPAKLVNEADITMRLIENQHGPLKQIKTPLFSNNGRLWKICDRHEITKAVSTQVENS